MYVELLITLCTRGLIYLELNRRRQRDEETTLGGGDVHVLVSRANLRRRGRCDSPLKFLHVQARPREIKFNGVWDEDLN